MSRVGAVLMGRRTFDLGVPNWGDVPFPVPCFVRTHRSRDDLAMTSGTFTFITEGPSAALRHAKSATGDRDVAIMGGGAGRQYLAAGLVDKLDIHLVPVLLGRGVRLLEHPGADPIGWAAPKVTQYRRRGDNERRPAMHPGTSVASGGADLTPDIGSSDQPFPGPRARCPVTARWARGARRGSAWPRRRGRASCRRATRPRGGMHGRRGRRTTQAAVADTPDAAGL
jgi:dihydrofolate reductase